MSIASPQTALPLEAIDLSIYPKATHCITWSPDAELAVACDDSVIIFVPEFSPRALPDEENGNGQNDDIRSAGRRQAAQQHNNTAAADEEGPRQLDATRALRFPITTLRDREFNRHLFAAVDQPFDGLPHFTGAGSGVGYQQGVIAGHGGTLNHAVAIEWSPASGGGLGLGRVRRSVLAVLTAAGYVTIYCQGASDGSDLFKVKVRGSGSGSGERLRNSRTLRPWCAVWCAGAGWLVPAAPGRELVGKRECVTAFAWARAWDTGGGAGDGGGSGRGGGGSAIMSYLNDEDELVLLYVSAKHDAAAELGHPGTWKVMEVARCTVEGPHPQTDPLDPDHTSVCRSSFALSWSPWLKRSNGSSCSFVAYVSDNYVGFRQVTITPNGGSSSREDPPKLQVGSVDASGVCVHLGTDAFVVWEDLIWTMRESKVCRGIIATPMRVASFELPFDSISPLPKHSTEECGSTYPGGDLSERTNPITGLVIHPPSLSQNTETPSYSLVRLSATSENKDWHQTNLPLPTNPQAEDSSVRWATQISQTIEHQIPRALVSNRPTTNMMMDDEDEDDDDDGDDGDENDSQKDGSTLIGIRGVDTDDQVHPNRMRIWGMAASPGGGTNAVFVTQHSTLNLERDTTSGMKCRILFGAPIPGTRNGNSNGVGHVDDGSMEDDDVVTRVVPKNLSTEARAWEWMYGGGAPVKIRDEGGTGDGVSGSSGGGDGDAAVLREQFLVVAQHQVCVFCKLPLSDDPKSPAAVRCANNHVFEKCANTGVPILAPDVSRTCGVCGLKSLKAEELVSLAPQLKDIVADDISSDLCGSCGGKFII